MSCCDFSCACSGKCPGICHPVGTTPRLPATVTVPHTANTIGHHALSLLRHVPLWLPPPFRRYLWQDRPATDTAVCFDHRAGRAGACVRSGGTAGSTTLRGAPVGEGVPEVDLSRAPVTATPNADTAPSVLAGARCGLVVASGGTSKAHGSGNARRRRCHAPGSSAGVFALLPCACPSLLHVTVALTAVMRAGKVHADDSRHGDSTGGVAWRRRHCDSLPPSRRGLGLPPDILGTCGTGAGPLRRGLLRPSDDTEAAIEGETMESRSLGSECTPPWGLSPRLTSLRVRRTLQPPGQECRFPSRRGRPRQIHEHPRRPAAGRCRRRCGIHRSLGWDLPESAVVDWRQRQQGAQG
jgi:hypothetical protein